MQIDETAPRDRPEVAQMIVIHKALRREFRLLPGIVAGVRAGDRSRAAFVAAHARLQLMFLHAHHDSEDRLIWPILAQRTTVTEDILDVMQRQHHAVDELVTEVRPLLADWTRRADAPTQQRIIAVLETLHTALEEHLDVEETTVLPLIQRHLTVAEWTATVKDAEKHLPKNPRSGLLLAGAVLEDSTPAERRWFLNELPGPARLMWRLLGDTLYRSHLRRTRGPAAA
ncbi:hemerythrin domain-containing protein [Micromonospora psammae]|uniref:hemerythrin domain-containing protein n=1 Tax=Micromonospora sp. CPCC 205556 TaxID=3122398 RepID=UPI002FF3BD57